MSLSVEQTLVQNQRFRHLVLAMLVSASFLWYPAVAFSKPPDAIGQFTRKFCNSCHGATEAKGDFRLDQLQWDLTDTESLQRWKQIYQYVSDSEMPPKGADLQPDQTARDVFLHGLTTEFDRAARDAPIGGTPLRRLNRVEYLNTARDLFGIRMIKLPLSFPEDATTAPFDTMPAGLFLSPAVMEAYHESATNIANRFVPLPNPPTYAAKYGVLTIGGDATRRWFGPKKAFLQFTGFNHSGWSGALWDSQFIAPACGVYRVRLRANAQGKTGADGKPLRLSFYAFDPTEEQLPKRYRRDRATRVAEIDIPDGPPQWIACDVPLEAGETFHIYCDNRFPVDHFPLGTLNRSQLTKLVKQAIRDKAPTVEIRGLELRGPVNILPRVRAFFGAYPPELSQQSLETRLIPLATAAYRRPLTEAERRTLIDAVLTHAKQTGKPEFAWHYAIRRLLCSPAFLYREVEQDQKLSQYALASRLSYFLWSTKPDDELLQLAAEGQLANPTVLAAQTRRLLADPKSQQFIQHFTGQWLGNRTVAAINVCDNRYHWDDQVRYGYIRSTEMFFEEVLRRNLPIHTFIDSDFTYANNAMLAVWTLPKPQKKLAAIAATQRQGLVWPEPERISLSHPPQKLPDHVLNRRGLLGLPGVLTVTGDGVESSPILRGVWVLENLFGQHPPPPPKDIPALDIDTRNASTVREILAAHQKNASCAKCHRDIDPLGLALENYDAIGGYRAAYAGVATPIDASTELPDGTQLNGPDSIRRILLERQHIFTNCLLTKLLEYGAGRELSLGDQRIVKQLVASTPQDGYRFQELIVAAVCSDVFLMK